MSYPVELAVINKELVILYGECDNCHQLIRAEITPDTTDTLVYRHASNMALECAPRYAEPDIELRLAKKDFLEEIKGMFEYIP